VGCDSPRCGARKPGRAYAAARPRDHLQISVECGESAGWPQLSYVGEWRSERGAVAEFKGEIDGISINGVDIITIGDDGRITNFKVMVRPLKVLNLLHQLMGEQLAKP
jgi:hypothetical protein